MPWEFFDRWQVEAWAIDGAPARTLSGSGVEEFQWTVTDPTAGQLQVIEIYDCDVDEKIGWRFALHRDGFLDAEELFVRPVDRRRGHGTHLAMRLKELAGELQLPLRAWIPFADAYQENRPALKAIVDKLGLSLGESGVQWAALQAVHKPGGPCELEAVRSPDRPAYERNYSIKEVRGGQRRDQIEQSAPGRERLSSILGRSADRDPWLDDDEDWEL
jgi:GNAT superfamily N-acetyltransferase